MHRSSAGTVSLLFCRIGSSRLRLSSSASFTVSSIVTLPFWKYSSVFVVATRHVVPVLGKNLMGAAFSTASNPPFDMTAAKDKVQKLAAEPIVVFSKSYCPYCTASKKLFTELGYEFKAYELDRLEDGDEIQNALAQITGQRTVPNNFIGGKSIGGNSDLQSLHSSGKLEGLLSQAKAVKL